MLLIIYGMVFQVGRIWAQEKVVIDFFYSKSCPHCADEKPFLDQLKKKYSSIEIRSHEVSISEERDYWFKEGQRLGVEVGPVPFTIIGDEYFVGFSMDYNAEQIEATVKNILGEPVEVKKDEHMIKLPFLGEKDWRLVSLPVLTFLIALVDGFNPCAMWTLLFLISLLLGMKDRKRMWILGLAFIFASSLVYFGMMAAWLNLFMWLGMVGWIRVLVGMFAVGAGGYSFYQWYMGKGGGCKTENSQKRQQVFARIKSAVSDKNLALAVLGIMVLAIAVNVIELACSAGLPAIYTKALVMQNLPSFKYYLYLLFYIFIFMLDDIVIFVIAMTTLRAIGVESKYSNWARLIGGLVMLWIGYAMLFKPEILSF
ncbi:MAG: hypothetical protein ABIJ43_04775 [Candidatus Beckwithbacteria bacterium]